MGVLVFHGITLEMDPMVFNLLRRFFLDIGERRSRALNFVEQLFAFEAE